MLSFPHSFSPQNLGRDYGQADTSVFLEESVMIQRPEVNKGIWGQGEGADPLANSQVNVHHNPSEFSN